MPYLFSSMRDSTAPTMADLLRDACQSETATALALVSLLALAGSASGRCPAIDDPHAVCVCDPEPIR